MNYIKPIITIFLLFILTMSHASTLVTKTIQQETPAYIIQIKYPTGFPAQSISYHIEQFINQIKTSFLNEINDDKDTPMDAPGKTGLNVNYAILYDQNAALSIRFDVSTYHKGAAHPLNRISVLNFLHGTAQNLNDLFKPHTHYLSIIASLCQQAISEKDISDPEWIKNGTKATPELYKVWYFTPTGIVILFNTYQVAAYVYGEQKVSISQTILRPMMRPDVIKTLWQVK